MKCLLACGVILLATACSPAQPEAAAPHSPTTTAPSVAAADTPDPIATSAPPAPSATTVPEPDPRPEPIFTRMVMPDRAVSEPTRTMFDAVAGQDGAPWFGVGHEFDSTVGISLPIVWSFSDADTWDYEQLPLTSDHSFGVARVAATAAGRQIIGGHIYQDNIGRAALWNRRPSDPAWSLDPMVLPSLPGRDQGESWVSGIFGSQDWGLLHILFQSRSETHTDGDPAHRSHLLTTTNGTDWQELELPNIAMDQWHFGITLHGRHGLIVAKRRDEEAPASRFFTTNDAGQTWTPGDVALRNNTPVTFHDGLWDDGEWILAGSEGVSDERIPVTFELTNDGDWIPRDVVIEGRTEDDKAIELSDVALDDIERFNDETFVGVLKLFPGSLTITSIDGVTWTARNDLWLNQHGPEENARIGVLIDSIDEGPILAVRGFSPPVWLTQKRVIEVDAPGFERTDRVVSGVVSYNGEFVVVTHDRDEPPLTHTWRLDDLDWSRPTVDPQHRPTTKLIDAGDAILSTGVTLGDGTVLRHYIDDGGIRSIDIRDLFNLNPALSATRVRSAPATERNLVAFKTSAGHIIVIFVDLSSPDLASAFEVPSLFGSQDFTVCPELDSGHIAIIARQPDWIGSYVEVWTDADEPIVGYGEQIDAGTFSNALLTSCSRLGSDLVVTGATCSQGVVESSTFSAPECEAQIWTSTDGLDWSLHPDRAQLHGISFATRGNSFDGGVLFEGRPQDEDGADSLWLVTSDEIARVPLDDVFSLNTLDLRSIAATSTHAVIATTTATYRAELDYLIERTRALDDQFPPADQPSTDTALTGLVEEHERLPPIPLGRDGQTQNAPAPPPATSAPIPAPTQAPTSVPAPAAPADPTPAPVPDATAGTDATLECESEIDSTGALVMTCTTIG